MRPAAPPSAEAFRREARACLRQSARGEARGVERDRLVGEASEAAEAELRRNPAEALRWARVAEALAHPRGAPAPDDALRWRVERGVAKAHHAKGDASAALAALDRLGRRRLEARRRADVESTRAVLLARCARPRAAAAAARRAREAFRRLGDAVGCAHVDVNEANALHRRDEHSAARRLYLRALTVLLREGRDVDAAAARVGLGNACTFLGRVG